MAITVVVNQALFLDEPTINAKVGDTPAEMRTERLAFFERLEMEHEMAAAANANHGRHNLGSARIFVNDTKNTAPEAPVYSASDGYAKGRLQYYPTAKSLKVHDGSDQVEIGYLATRDTPQTVEGVTTFEKNPISEVVTAPAGDTSLVNKKQMTDLMTAALLVLENVIHPVGFKYIQFPGGGTPAAMGWAGTWALDHTYAGYALRIGKFGASKGTAFPGTELQNVGAHTHTAAAVANYKGLDPNESSNGTRADKGVGDGYDLETLGITVTVDANSADDDVRMDSVTIQVWNRTA